MPDTISKQKRKNTLDRYKLLIFLLTYFSYATLHAARQSWSFIKSKIKSDPESGFDTTFLGQMDSAFLMSYAIGLATLGHYGDRVNLKYFTTAGMLLTSCSLIAVGTLELKDVVILKSFIMFSQIVFTCITAIIPCFFKFDLLILLLKLQLDGSIKKIVFLLLWILNGVGQSTGMPGFVAAMGNWFGSTKRGILMGIWIGMTNFGDIMGYVLGGVLTDSMDISWGYVPIVAASLIIFMIVLLLLFMYPYPDQLGINVEEDWSSIFNDDSKKQEQEENEMRKRFNSSMFSNFALGGGSIIKRTDQTASENSAVDPTKFQVNFFSAWVIPNVATYAFLFASLKSTIYGLLFWLPNYLSSTGSEGQLSTTFVTSCFDVGIFLGGMTVGLITDRLGKRGALMGPFILVSTGVMGICLISNSQYFIVNVIIFSSIGFFIGGPYNVCQSAIMVDLAKQKALKHSTKAVSTVTSLIDGTGALFASLTQLVIPYVGVDHVFWVLFGLTLVSLVLLAPITIRDISSLLRRKRRELEYFNKMNSESLDLKLIEDDKHDEDEDKNEGDDDNYKPGGNILS